MAGQASIVYEGAAGAGGNLFAGTKFFLQQRVPFRNTFKEMITVSTFPSAFYLTDHARAMVEK